jgi:SET domain-containing protein
LKWERRPSPIHGHGVFAAEPVEKDECIGVSHDGYPYDIKMLPLGNYNHSETPSAYSRLVVAERCRKIFAARQLAAGEEITLDFREAPELEQPQTRRVWDKKPAFRDDLATIYAVLGMLFPR